MIQWNFRFSISLFLSVSILLSAPSSSFSADAASSSPAKSKRQRCIQTLGALGAAAVIGGSVTLTSHIVGSDINGSARISIIFEEEKITSQLSRSDREAIESKWKKANNYGDGEFQIPSQINPEIISEREHALVAYTGWRDQLSRLKLLDGKVSFPEGLLSELWAQEIIGADLVQTDPMLLSTPGAKVAILDSGFFERLIPLSRLQGKVDNRIVHTLVGESTPDYWHGTAVANLIVGPLVGTSPNAVITLAHGYSYDGLLNSETKDTFAQVLKERPQLINLSRAVDSSDEAGLRKILANGTIPIVAAGNVMPGGFFGFGENTRLQESNLDAPGILVANLDHFGMPYRAQGGLKASVAGPNVFIGAPSGYNIQSITVNYDDPGSEFGTGTAPIQIQNFGGTSGAAPVATGSVSNLLSLVPELTYDEVRIIIEKTALKTLNSHAEPRVHGVGMINALKLVEVGKRLQARGFPNNRDDVLKDESLYNFRVEARSSYEVARKAFESAASNDAKEAALAEMRRAFLLDPAEVYREFLVKGYEDIDLPENANFYRMMNSDINAALHYGLNSDLSRVRAQTLAMAELIGPKTLPALEFNVDHPNTELQLRIRAAIARLRGVSN